jgi:hypothetical protein
VVRSGCQVFRPATTVQIGGNARSAVCVVADLEVQTRNLLVSTVAQRLPAIGLGSTAW